MKVRNSERSHDFTKRLFDSEGIFSLQGLLVDDEDNFTAGIEAIELENGEEINIGKTFNINETKAKVKITELLGIPLYYVFYKSNKYEIYRILKKEDTIYSRNELSLDEKGFIEWWSKLKKMKQTKPIFEASPRLGKTIFDGVLEKHGLAWGGNIDGFILLHDNKLGAIIENIYTAKHPLDSPKGEPSYYFHSKGPNFNTWKPVVNLASRLNVPLYLMTYDANSDEEKVGFTIIDHLSTDGISYKLPSPNNNIIHGLLKIKSTLLSNLNASPPYIE